MGPSARGGEIARGRWGIRLNRVKYPRCTATALTLMSAVVLIDQVSKLWAVHALTPDKPLPVLGEWFRLYLVRNPGAAFSMGTQVTIVFSLIQLAAVILCLVLSLRSRSMWSALSIGLIGGGAAGNLLDRIFRSPGGMHGHVVDFFSFWSFAVFNVADSAITVGVAVYLVYSLVVEPARTRQVAAPAGGKKEVHG
ncbi:signal peptidase II [Corynebacterium heidelbergense]|uniref:Lipoprotein signal peptidase n=1 Tax=Corynebacterium heidelbergense TaxID=2055947 RepID=A0A364V3P8_9CORY|nr:signal peptidase II [Corynebacterium heidelbergense]